MKERSNLIMLLHQLSRHQLSRNVQKDNSSIVDSPSPLEYAPRPLMWETFLYMAGHGFVWDKGLHQHKQVLPNLISQSGHP